VGNAELAARAAMEKLQPRALVSAGLAGALMRSLKIGNIVMPNVIIDSANGIEYRCKLGGEVIGGGVLVTSVAVASPDAKQQLVERFHGLIVDMEAAGVARVAHQHGIGFRCVKAISDEVDFKLPPLQHFVNKEGDFQSGAFAAWAVVRPQNWIKIAALARNSARAAAALCDWLSRNLDEALQAAEVVTLENPEFSKT
jgi:adenosylhomocysteine nucleosidase